MKYLTGLPAAVVYYRVEMIVQILLDRHTWVCCEYYINNTRVAHA